MSSIYKYMKLKHLQDALEYGVHASKFGEVNDPYEGEGIENPDDFRIACMTNSPRKMLLWAYYVNHRGCCVEFDMLENVDSIIKKVKYEEELADRAEMSMPEIIESLWHKGKEWEHENEYRAVYYVPNEANSAVWIEKGNSTNVFLKLPVKSVTFGINSQKDDSYVDAIELICEYNKKTGSEILIQKVKKSPSKYELIDNKQFDVKSELRKYGKTV